MYAQRGKNSVLYDEQLIRDKYNISPNQYVIFKSLVGDKCDNITGINSIGKITAAKILNYGTIEEFIKKSENQKLIDLIKVNIEIVNKNKKLISLNDEIDTFQTTFAPLTENIFTDKVREIIDKIGLS